MPEQLNISDYDLYKKKQLTRTIFLKALERSLLILGAFIYFNIIGFFKKDIDKYIPFGKNLYTVISLTFHLIFIFTLDLVLLYTFAYIFGTPI
jgi:hypothetical protein